VNILIIEDNKEILDFLKSSLKEEGFVVDAAEDGGIGLEKALSGKYDLIIMDNILPVKEGRQICAEIRKNDCRTPVIILSVKSDVDTKIDLLNTGADDYLTKPFSFSELLARIRALLRRPPAKEHLFLQIGDLIIDQTSHAVKCGEKEISLTPKEFVLLEYMVRHRGEVLSRAKILEHAWDMNADPFTNTIETHILNLRKKLGGKDKESFIRTVPGVGYRMD
jgi:DNA-binding response OmpR family regulator